MIDLDDIISLFPVPFYTSSGILFDDDFRELDLEGRVGALPPETRSAVLRSAYTLASVQSELGLRMLLDCVSLVDAVGKENLPAFVELILDLYDARGIKEALIFMADPRRHPEFSRLPGVSLTFEQVSSVLTYFLHSLGTEDLTLQKAACCYTDTQVIYVPKEVAFFGEKKLDFLLYKLMVVNAFFQIKKKIFSFSADVGAHVCLTLGGFIQRFDCPALAEDIYCLVDMAVTESIVQDEMPGLHADLARIKKMVLERRGPNHYAPVKTRAMEYLVRLWLWGTAIEPAPSDLSPFIEKEFVRWLIREARTSLSNNQTLEVTDKVYRWLSSFPGSYEPIERLPFVVELRPEEAEKGLRRKRESVKVQFQHELAKLIGEIGECETHEVRLADKNLRPIDTEKEASQEIPSYILVDARPIPVPEAMRKIIEKIYEDLGTIPSSYLAVSEEMSGHHYRPVCKMPEGTGYFLSENDPDVHVLDEWDYRREGFRKHWVLMKEIVPMEEDPNFLALCFRRYGGMINKIKREFERIRQQECIEKRQREGEDIDLEALVEAFSDLRAGRSPSEYVFTRLNKDRRSVASAFLVDLSGSTKGWINEVERVALLILAEALDVLGDRFAIYGFSGQTRKRCELYRIMAMDEPYGERVRRRIAGLKAREWTRMGPPIRHVTKILNNEDAKTRLLISLSDGKPDDYDYYKGDYAMEDTRHALIEAKGLGIRPFCITIDKAEHSYLSYMYGEGNYMFVSDLAKLPCKMPEIYRKISS